MKTFKKLIAGAMAGLMLACGAPVLPTSVTEPTTVSASSVVRHVGWFKVSPVNVNYDFGGVKLTKIDPNTGKELGGAAQYGYDCYYILYPSGMCYIYGGRSGDLIAIAYTCIS